MFRITRRGVPSHAVKLRGVVTDQRTLAAFDPQLVGLQIKIGAFVAAAHSPTGDDSRGGFKLRKGVWRLRTKVNGVRTKLKLDSINGRLSLDVRGANAGALRAGGPKRVTCSIEVGTALADDVVVFDERRRGGSTTWASLPPGVAIGPPVQPPSPVPVAQGSLVFAILTSGQGSQVLQPTVMVARTDSEWMTLYDKAIFPSFNSRPVVDFNQDMVIGIFMGLVNQVHEQKVELLNVTDTLDQLHVSWRQRFGCFQFACSGGLNSSLCQDFAPFMFVRVRRNAAPAVSDRAPSVYDKCK